MNNQRNIKIIISGGGTGGHVFPAISIANALKAKDKNIDILFVGAIGKMEMEKVPAAGYKIVGLPVMGFHRKFTFKNFLFFFKLLSSMLKAGNVVTSFKPDVVVGVGGFASGPILRVASRRNNPALIQEQNSYPGVTNKILAKSVNKICVAYEGLERYFPAEKIIITGNPVRQDLENIFEKKEEALKHFDLAGNKRVILIVGGSLGARTVNLSLYNHIKKLIDSKVQIIWQTGKEFFPQAEELVKKLNCKDIKVFSFVSRMDLAYSVADLVVSRAGASTISELCLVHKPAIFVPSPNVAEDHQTKNAMAMITHNAAMMVEDKEAEKILVDLALDLVKDDFRLSVLRENIAKMAYKNSANLIADEILKLVGVNERN
ncbi:MAG: undecaprenyldiphospho-muramoylpentapeptide beta-N-acetylglucosaminyltransferase [Bacteroidetes bacterium GWA2_31_9]|nr:MAG: undecaprenyldiphospho-muramoylpentapeptide beta-N-acetylglucosaminyltransferase [Bacteroidetes bacterium GWA2_31_9]